MKNVIISIILAAVMLFGAVACTKTEAYELGAVDLRYADTLQIAEDCGITLRDDRVLDIETLESICDLARAMYSRYSSVTFETDGENGEPTVKTIDTQIGYAARNAASFDSAIASAGQGTRSAVASEYIKYIFELKTVTQALIKNYVSDSAYYKWPDSVSSNAIWPDYVVAKPEEATFGDWDGFVRAKWDNADDMPSFIEIYESWIEFRDSSSNESTTVFPNAEEDAAFSRAFEIKREDTDR